MAANAVIRPLRSGDLEHVGGNLCDADKCTYVAILGEAFNAVQAVQQSVLSSSQTWAVEVDGQTLAIFGVVTMCDGIGSPWMACTNDMFKHPRDMLVSGRRYVALMCERYDMLIGLVDARNKGLQRWLEKLGFVFSTPESLGPYEVPFHRFELRSEECVSQPQFHHLH